LRKKNAPVEKQKVHRRQKPEFKIWTNTYDFCEVNPTNRRKVTKEYFQISTKKITLLGLLFAVNVVFTLISRFLLGAIPGIAGFLTFNITLWTIFVTFMAFNFFYSVIFLELSVWFRVLYDPNIPGLIAINLNDLSFLICLALFSFLLNRLRFHLQKDYSPTKKVWGYFWTLIVSLIMATLVVSALDVLYNWGFLITIYNKWYGLAFEPNTSWLLITIFWFNIVQAIINILIFSAIYKISYTLIDKYFVA